MYVIARDPGTTYATNVDTKILLTKSNVVQASSPWQSPSKI